MTSNQLLQWIQHPETLDRDSLYELRTLLGRYPYFQSLRLLYLKNLYLLHDASFGQELRKSVPYVADSRTLFYLIEGDRYLLKPHAPSSAAAGSDVAEGADRTLSLIDAFLATMPQEQQSQTAELDYAMDYTAYLMQDEESADAAEAEQPEAEVPRMRGHELIDGFIRRNESPEGGGVALPVVQPEEPVATDADEEEEEDAAVDEVSEESYFTETLAKIYIKQQRYEKALEIIKRLSLNYPKKNAYFADQIRFLEKLIINAKSK
ncbi:MAG: tetratricopeptide repeat protein [Bacteroides sp.]